MNRIIYFLVIILSGQLVFSCKNFSDRTDSSDKTEDENAYRECYLYVSGSDSIKMDITINENRISGTLDYIFFEKDKSTGTIKGELRGDKLTASYRFKSEGKESSRQVIFKKIGDNYSEGNYVDGNYTMVNFPGTVVLGKVDCE